MIFGSWSKGTPSCANDEEIKKLLFTAENSSRHRPGLARLHNDALKSSSGLNLLTIPLWLRNRIFRLALIHNKPITVSAEKPTQCMEPSLLFVCHDIRNLARPMFYCENDFTFKVRSFNVLVLQPWAKKFEAIIPAAPEQDFKYAKVAFGQAVPNHIKFSDPYHGHYVHDMNAGQDWVLTYQLRQLQQVQAQDVTIRGSQSWNVEFTPHWQNLVDWLRLWHAGETGCYQPHFIDDGPQKALEGVFDLVAGRRGESWKVVNQMLPSVRKTLAGSDERWGEDAHERGEDQDMFEAAEEGDESASDGTVLCV